MAGDIKWIKITTDMFEDEKIDFIANLPEADAIIVIWVRLLTLAGKCNAGGYVMLTEKIPYTEEMLAHKFRKPPSVIRLAIETFRRLEMMEIDNSVIYLPNWEKHQNVEAMEKVKEYERLRKAKQREKKKLKELMPANDPIYTNVPDNVPTNVPDSPSDVTVIDIDKELDKEKDKNIYTLIPDDTKIIFDHWNSKGITKHRELTQSMRGKIHARLVNMTVDEFNEAIDNYCEIISDNETYWYSHKFTLQEFANPKNIDRFLTENNPFETMKRSDPFGAGSRSKTQRNSNVPDIEETRRWNDNFERMAQARRMRQNEMGDE